jgi:Flp pilus assembly protein TadG
MNMRSTSRLRTKGFRPRWRRFVEGGKFLKDERGVTAIEFALVLPVVVLILLGCFEVPRFVLIFQKIARTSSGVADLVAQADEAITKRQMDDIYTAGKIMMQPNDVVANGRIYVSSINNPSGGTGVKITWQTNNGGAVATASKLGAEGSDPTGKLPAALVPATNEEVLAAEVFFNYQPIFSTLIYQGSQLYMVSYTRPRNKNLMTKPPAACPAGVAQC